MGAFRDKLNRVKPAISFFGGDNMPKQIKGRPTVLQMDILDLWVQGYKPREIADQLNCSLEVIRLVKNNESYKKLFAERQRGQIIDLVPLAVKRLRAILQDDAVLPSAQIQAIREVFERANIGELTSNSEIKISVSYD